ncbi:small GTP-binding protein [gamma proteobacterium HTCC5015]|nr:small GTP-binding protein [gamma proteobacterium HTCC5015]
MNMSAHENYNKLVFAGPVGAGKSTAIAAISETPPVSTEETLSSGAMGDKTTTTVALDYSFLNLEGSIIHIYGMPGQARLGFMRNIVLEGALGVVLLLNGESEEVYNDASYWLRSIREISPQLNVVIGITKTENNPDLSLNELRGSISQIDPKAPILSVDAREEDDMKQLLKILLALHMAQAV